MFTTLWQHRGFQTFWNTHDSFVLFLWVTAAPHKHVVNSDTAAANSAGAVLPGPLRGFQKKYSRKWQEIMENWILSTDSFHFCFWFFDFWRNCPLVSLGFFDFSGLQTFSLPMRQQLTQTDHRHRTSWLTADIAQIFKGLAPATKQRVAWSNDQFIGSRGRIHVIIRNFRGAKRYSTRESLPTLLSKVHG